MRPWNAPDDAATTTLSLTNRDGVEGATLLFPAVAEWLSLIPAIVLARLFTVAQGNDPDYPRGLSKVTKDDLIGHSPWKPGPIRHRHPVEARTCNLS